MLEPGLTLRKGRILYQLYIPLGKYLVIEKESKREILKEEKDVLVKRKSKTHHHLKGNGSVHCTMYINSQHLINHTKLKKILTLNILFSSLNNLLLVLILLLMFILKCTAHKIDPLLMYCTLQIGKDF